MLRNLTDLSPVLFNKTRWSGKYAIINRFVQIREELIEVADTDGAVVAVNRSEAFKVRAEKYRDMLREINAATTELQKRHNSLSDCRYIIDTLLEEIEKYSSDSSSALYNCKLKDKYIGTSAQIMTDPVFESGVIKIQRNEYQSITINKNRACKKLRIQNAIYTAPENPTFQTMAEKVAAKKKRKLEATTKYMNCSFILGSVAEVERLWSIAKNILRDNRKSMTPIVFESLLFLKVNSKYWNQALVSEAMRACRSTKVEKQIQEDKQQSTG